MVVMATSTVAGTRNRRLSRHITVRQANNLVAACAFAGWDLRSSAAFSARRCLLLRPSATFQGRYSLNRPERQVGSTGKDI
jgi:hypothetical protein